MSSHADRTGQARPDARRSGDLELGTLIVAAVASAIAAFVTSKIWPSGALWSAAASPIIVALAKEALNRPASRLQTIRLRTPRPPGDDSPSKEPSGELTSVTVHRGSSRRRWRLAIVTGLLAFSVVAVLYTVPELVRGRSLGAGEEKRTTLFGGKPAKDEPGAREEKPPEATPSATPGATPSPGATATPTVTPDVTPTVTPATTATPVPSVPVTPTVAPAPSP